jgi:hypothetical protein
MAQDRLVLPLNQDIFEERLARFLILNEDRFLGCGKIPLIETPQLFAH